MKLFFVGFEGVFTGFNIQERSWTTAPQKLFKVFFIFPGRLFASIAQEFEPTFNDTPAVVCAITSCKAYSCEVITAVYCSCAKEGGQSWVKNLVWKISDSFQILVEDLGWKPWIGKEIFRFWERFSSTSGRRTTQNPETLRNARSYPRFFRIQKLDPTRSEFT
jgi:hypothetical protein